MLTSEIDEGFLSWIEVTAANTLAKIITEAAKRLMPNFDESEIVVDVIKKEDDVGIFQLVLSEMSPGGIGLIEDLADEFALDPRMFFSVVSSVTAANEQELVDAQLREIISSCQEHGSVFARRFDDFRNATSAEQKDAQRSEVINTLVQNDHVLFHSFQTTLFPGCCGQAQAVRLMNCMRRFLNFGTNSTAVLALKLTHVSFLLPMQVTFPTRLIVF